MKRDKVQYKIGKFNNINPSIKVGDKVRLIDGSSLTSFVAVEESLYIVFSYPDLTGSEINLELIEGEVVEVGLSDSFCADEYLKVLWRQDIVIRLGDGLFYCSSGCVVIS